MIRIVVVVTCLLMTMGVMTAGEFDAKALKTLVAKLGADGFRERRKAQKTILTEIQPLQAKYLALMSKTNDSPSDELKSLTQTLVKLMGTLEESSEKSEDPEVKMRVKKIIGQLHPLMLYQQPFAVQKVVCQPFKDLSLTDDDGDTEVLFSGYKVGNVVIAEVCNLRIVRIVKRPADYSSVSHQIPVSVQPNRGIRMNGNDFSYDASDELTTCKWNHWELQFRERKYLLDGKRFAIGKNRTVIFVDDNGNHKATINLGAVAVPATSKKK